VRWIVSSVVAVVGTYATDFFTAGELTPYTVLWSIALVSCAVLAVRELLTVYEVLWHR
jgi:hypothetical protein